jgi:tetratricopeptide (TPR) repeat protein
VPALVSLSRLNLQAGQYGSALNFAQQAARLSPGYEDARAALLWALLGEKNLKRAHEELRSFAVAFPASPQVHVLRGALSMMERNPKSAEQSFAKALEMQPGSHDALSGVLASRLAAGNVAGARAEAEAAVARTPTDAPTLVLAARTYRAAGQLDRAERVLRQAIETNPQQLDAYSMLGQIYIAQRRLNDALKEFDELSRRQSNPVSAHTVVGMLLQATNRRAEAKERYQKALAIDPNAAVAANNLAWLQAEDGGNLDVALRLAQTAKSRLPESPEVNDTLGYILYLKGLYSSAIDALRVSVARDPGNPTYQYRLGMAYAKNGNAALARESLNGALRINAAFDGAKEARATLLALS